MSQSIPRFSSAAVRNGADDERWSVPQSALLVLCLSLAGWGVIIGAVSWLLA